MNLAIDPSKKSFSDINQSSLAQRDADKVSMAVGTNYSAPTTKHDTANSNNAVLVNLRNQEEQEIEMASAAAKQKQAAAVFNGNTELASKITEPQRDSAADSPWCNCENCQTA